MKKDIATVFGDAYARSAPKVLGDQHACLLDSLEKHFSQNPDGTLLVLGCGGYVLPYSCKYTEDGRLGGTNRERVKKMIGNGKIVLLDYSLGSLLKADDTLERMGFFENGFFQASKFIYFKRMNPADFEKSTISRISNNLKDNLGIEDRTIYAVDANLSIHHASVTRAELERVYREIFRVLQPGGFLHLGEGNVDMNYSEEKMIHIGTALFSTMRTPVVISDGRDLSHSSHYLFTSEKNSELQPIPLEDCKKYLRAEIRGNGNFVIGSHVAGSYGAEFIENALRNLGFRNVRFADGEITMPFIDPKMPDDFEGLVKPVDKFYDAILLRARTGYSGMDDALLAEIEKGIEFERNNARKGLIEHYMGEDKIVNALNKCGFVEIQATHHQTEPFYNITARKPK